MTPPRQSLPHRLVLRLKSDKVCSVMLGFSCSEVIDVGLWQERAFAVGDRESVCPIYSRCNQYQVMVQCLLIESVHCCLKTSF